MGRFISASTFASEVVTVSNTPFTATAGKIYVVNTTSAPVLINIPSADQANVGDKLTIVDATGSWSTNNCTVGINTLTTKIANLNENLVLNIPHNSVELLYSGAGFGWVLLNA